MQIESISKKIDTMVFTSDMPVIPLGSLFTYYPSEVLLELHYHDFFEIGYCEGGAGVFNVDGKIIPFEGKYCSVIYPNQVHIAKSIDPHKSLWHFLYIDLKSLYVDQRIFIPDYQNYEYPPLLQYKEDPDCYELIKLIHLEAARAQVNCILVLRDLVSALLLKLERHRKSSIKSKEGKMNPAEINAVISYITTEYFNDINIETLCNIAKTSRASLQRKFHSATGMSPMSYLQNMRLNYAALMLQENIHSISQIAMNVGYNSLSSFNRHFLRKYGMAPSKWRKNQLGKK